MSWTKEERLLIKAATLHLSERDKKEIEKLSSPPVDWFALSISALKEGVEGLLYTNFRLLQEECPYLKKGVEALKPYYYDSLLTGMRVWKELNEFLPSLVEEVHPLILLKGAALTLTLYKDSALRPMRDVDILVRPNDLPKIEKTLKTIGFSSHSRYPHLFSRKGLSIDLHHDLANLSRISSRCYIFQIDYDALWKKAEPLCPLNPYLLTLSLHHQLITLSAHLVKHSFERLIWAVDIKELIKSCREGIDFPSLIEEAQRFNLLKPLLYTMTYLREVMGLELGGKETVYFEEMGQEFNPLERGILRLLTQGEKLERFGDLLLACSAPRLRERFVFLWETSFPRPRVIGEVFPFLPSLLLWVGYILRLFQLLAIGIKQSINLVKGWLKLRLGSSSPSSGQVV